MDRNLRKELCDEAGLDCEVWKTGAAEKFEKVVQSLKVQARQQEVGDALLEFDSEPQAAFVRDELTRRGVLARLVYVNDGKIGLSVRWGENPVGPEMGTGKIAIRVSPYWELSKFPPDARRFARAYWPHVVDLTV